MSVSPYWSEAYQELGPIFYELVGFYERQFNRDPTHFLVFDNNLQSSEVIPVYKDKVLLPTYIMYLSQLPLVNRLTEIKQLSHTSILFPGATHTRYEHSIGVMHRAGKLLTAMTPIVQKKCNHIKFTEDDRIILQISALLHDVGHPAWGHALDGITGYVVQLLKEVGVYLFSPKKLDNTLAIYLLTENEQMQKGLVECSEKIKQKNIASLLPEIVAQIIIEEEYPYFDKLTTVPGLMNKIRLLTTIIGRYAKGPGINADRLDWLLRDGHHANVNVKLLPSSQKKYQKFVDLNANDKFDLDVEDCEFCTISDKKFQNLMDNLREELYSTIYEGVERSFTDSLLIRLAYSTIYVLHNIGNRIAGNHITTRAIMGYLLMYDYSMKEYTNRVLNLSSRHRYLLKANEPVTVFSSRSYKLSSILDNLKCIMHYLSTIPPRHETRVVAGLSLDLSYIDIMQIEKSLIMITASTAGKLIEKAAQGVKASEAEKMILLFHDIVAASRVDAIGVLRIPALEISLQKSPELTGWNNYLLMNYYFFRKLDDDFRDKNITNLKNFTEVLSSDFPSTPFLFIITDRKEITAIQTLFDKVCLHLIERFRSFFQTLDLQQSLKPD
jgi:hypothetical protein